MAICVSSNVLAPTHDQSAEKFTVRQSVLIAILPESNRRCEQAIRSKTLFPNIMINGLLITRAPAKDSYQNQLS